jgi:DNA end-binding protein Ku
MARGIWKGTLGFGLVSIGVELFGAESAKSLDLDMLDKRDHAPIGYKKYNKNTGAEIESDDIVKGYAVSKGRYVILSNEDLKSANPKASQTIDVVGFVPASDIDLIYFDKPYVVGPLKGSEKAYALFVKTLEDTEQVGIAQVVIRTKQYMAALYPYKHSVVVHLLRYHDEVRQPADLGVEENSAARQAIRPQELAMARQLVDSMAMEWNPAEFHDTYREDLIRMIHERAESGEEVAASAADVEAPEPRVLDLMAALKGSLAARAKESVEGKPSAQRVERKDRKAAANASAKSDDDENEDEAESKKPARTKRASKSAARKSA